MRKLEIKQINPNQCLANLYKAQKDTKKKERILAIYKMQSKGWR